MPNILAFCAVFSWPIVATIAFRRLPLAAGISAALLGGFLLLPTRTAVDLPMLPSFDKNVSAILAALLLVLLSRDTPARQNGIDALPGWIPGSIWVRLCLASAVGGSMVTAVLNSDPLIYGSQVLPGLSLYDGCAAILSLSILFLPFIIGRKYLASSLAHRHFLLVLIVAAVLYAIPTLYEIRMSPQLNRDIYGFFPASFLQHLRGDGFRPIVFLNHGLVLSLTLSLATLAALASARHIPERRSLLVLLAAFLFVTLILSKSLGALAITLLFAPVILLFPTRGQLLVAAGIAVVILAYPALRAQGVLPVDRIVELAEQIDVERAGSLQFRLEQEEALLAKAESRPVFGWGGWGRARLYDSSGKDISVSDGTWVILFGQGGWVLYLSVLSLLCFPVLQLSIQARRLEPDGVTAALAVLLAANLVDLLPNSSLIALTWTIAGALTGRLEWERAATREGESAESAAPQALFSPRIPNHDMAISGHRMRYRPVLPELSPSKRGPGFSPPGRDASSGD